MIPVCRAVRVGHELFWYDKDDGSVINQAHCWFAVMRWLVAGKIQKNENTMMARCRNFKNTNPCPVGKEKARRKTHVFIPSVMTSG